MNTAWLLVPQLRRLGYELEAERIVAEFAAMVERHGYREYYNPLNGEGLAARRFGWSTLLVDMLPDPGGLDGQMPPGWRREDEHGVLGEAWLAGREAASTIAGTVRSWLPGS
jgi:hypothetical protein